MKNSRIVWGLGLLALTLAGFGMILTKSNVTTAQRYGAHSQYFIYTGIDNITETVYSIDFSGQTMMQFIGDNESIFHVSQIPVIMNGIDSERNKVDGLNSNILGGDGVIIRNSDNITVIGGGSGEVKSGNSNATFFGGYSNQLFSNDDADATPTVLLGGEENKVYSNSDGNVIVGGSQNEIAQGSKNVNILGGNEIRLSGNNVIVGGNGISNANVSDSFIFNDGDSTVSNLEGSGMFFLNVVAGVGFGTKSTGNTGAISNGAVNIGEVDISSVLCTDENIGLMGVDDKCLVGCTSLSAPKWTLLDHGVYCDNRCETNSDNCTQVGQEDSEGIIEDYTSFCTVGNAITGNASMCPNLSLNAYKNVLFETYLVASEDECPTNVYNQCVYHCNSGAHLTGDQSGKFTGTTMCFNDCALPWDHSVKKQHNEIIFAYTTGNVSCLNETGYTCADYKIKLMCVDGGWHTMNGDIVGDLNTDDNKYDSCSLYKYSCDSEFNLTREDIVNQKRDFITAWKYGNLDGSAMNLLPPFYSEGTITPHSGYFVYDEILQWEDDEPKQSAGATQTGVRGQYTMCIEYYPESNSGLDTTNTSPNNERACGGQFPTQYRYRFDGCNTGYKLEDGVCRKNCEYGGEEIQHLGEIVLYTGTYARCPSTCENNSKTFTCYDGTLYADLQQTENGEFSSGTPQSSTEYIETGCVVECPQCGSVNRLEYEDNIWFVETNENLCSGSVISGSVVSYSTDSGTGYSWTCATGYSSQDCSAIHDNDEFEFVVTFDSNRGTAVHSQSVVSGNMATRPNDPEFPGYEFLGWYLTGENMEFNFMTPIVADLTLYAKWEYALDFEDLEMYFLTNEGGTGYGALMDRNLGATEAGTGSASYGYHYQWGNNYGFPSQGPINTSTTKVDASGYGPEKPYANNVFINTIGNWSRESNDNLWGGNGSEADRQGPCPDGYHVPTDSEFRDLTYDGYGDSIEDYNHWTSDSLMPSAGHRNGRFNIVYEVSAYWTSSPENLPGVWMFSCMPETFWDASRMPGVDTWGINVLDAVDGAFVRCFKNSPTPSLILHPNGGKKTVIIVHDGIITKLGEPTKEGYTFDGWYTEETGGQKVGVGSGAVSNLYARWSS